MLLLAVLVGLAWYGKHHLGMVGTSPPEVSSPEAITALAAGSEAPAAPAPREAINQAALVLPRLDHDQLVEKAEALDQTGRYRFATARSVAVRPATHGSWTSLGGGRSSWALDIRSAGATSINLAFEKFQLPPGATLRLGGNKGETEYQFTARDNDAHGQLWTPLVLGEDVSLSVEIDDALAPQLQLALAQVNHGFRGMTAKASKIPPKIGDASSGSCNIDVNCTTADDAQFGPLIEMYRDQIRSVGAYTLNGTDTCTGALINNTAGDTRPLFLTADHCGVSTGTAASMVVYWNFENTTCRQPGSSASGTNGDGPLTQFNSGAIFRAGNAASDFTIVELDDPVDPGSSPFFAGWDRSGANPAATIAIHHPGVSEKRISFDLDPSTTSDYYGDSSPGDGTHVRVADWDFGTTEPGSSGSPLFDDSGRIIGQLHGGDAACGNDLPDWYGRVSASWAGGGSSATRLSDWLDPGNSGSTAIGGINSDELLSVASQTITEGDAGTTTVLLVVTLTPATTEQVTVRLRTVNDSAIALQDYVALDQVLTFAPNQTSQVVSLTINGDTTPEEHESIAIELSAATNAIADQAPASVTILNDDYITPQINSSLAAGVPSRSALNYQITAANTPTSYEIASAPSGMAVDALTGELSWVAAAPGNYSAQIIARNPAGADTETLQITVTENSLAVALDIPSSVALSNGDSGPWTLQTVETNDGIDAARSAAINDSETSSFSINVTGPDALRFFWKVSSEAGFDFLSVSVDSTEMESISGTVDWTEVQLAIPAGDHVVTWQYSKDGSVSESDDAAWVDQLSLASVTGEPIITSPLQVGASLVEPFDYTITAFGPGVTFTVGELPSGLMFDGTDRISGTPTEEGIFEVDLEATSGAQSSAATLVLLIIPPVGPTVEQPSREWIPSGDQPWFGQQATTFDGQDAAQAGSIGDNEVSTVSINVTGPDSIAFWWKVSSEQAFDFLRFELDGQPLMEISGEVDWARESFNIPAGAHTLSWSYEKDSSAADGQDTGWLDQVELASNSPEPFLTSPLIWTTFVGAANSYQITAINSPQTLGASGLPVGFEVDSQTGIVSGVSNTVGDTSFTIWAENGFGRTEVVVTLRSIALDTAIPPAIEQPNLAVDNNGTAWVVVGDNASAGSTSARSAAITDNESSAMTAHVVGPGSGSFDWSVSSEQGFDFLRFYIDGVEQAAISGDVGFTQVDFDIPAGQHELRWSYQKDGSEESGDDAGWIDNLQLGGYAAYATGADLVLANAQPTADPDGDGSTNLLEYVFATDPGETGERPRIDISAIAGGDHRVEFTGIADLAGIELTLQQNDDLSGTWTDTGIIPNTTPSGVSGQVIYSFDVPKNTEAGFFRIGAALE